MSTYSVAQIQSLTGISAHKLRMWERRYGFLKPKRTATNIRYYSDNDLIKLINIGILVKSGLRVSEIDHLTESEINHKVSFLSASSKAGIENEIAALTVAMINFDEVTFSEILTSEIRSKGMFTAMMGLIYPFLNHIGILWITNKSIPAQEHFVSNLIRQKLLRKVDELHDVPEDARSIVLFLPPWEDHELGLILAQYIAKRLRWRVLYLGQKVPFSNINEAIENTGTNLTLTLLMTPQNERQQKQFKEFVEEISVPILVSGNPAQLNKINSPKLITLSGPEDLNTYLINNS
jgi:DNA-binding transcriptional MerR regulator